MDVRQQQLGMNPSTASGRLVKDVLYKLVVQTGNNGCHRCGKQMTRETFSIEHKIPWLHSETPVDLYFDLENISFSHLTCNIRAARPRAKPLCGTNSSYASGCRCKECTQAMNEVSRKRYTPERRRKQYER